MLSGCTLARGSSSKRKKEAKVKPLSGFFWEERTPEEQVVPHVMLAPAHVSARPSQLTTSSWGFQCQAQGKAQAEVKYRKAPTQGEMRGLVPG